MSDKVNHPPHYGGAGNPREAIKVIEAAGLGWGFALGSAVKYLLRASKKGDTLGDLGKAMWFIRRAVALFSATDGHVLVDDAGPEVAPDPNAASICVITSDPAGGHFIRSGDEAAEFLGKLELVQAGCPAIWSDGTMGGRFWAGDLTPVQIGLAYCPFSLPVVMLQSWRDTPPAPPAPRRRTPTVGGGGSEDSDIAYRYLKARADVEQLRAQGGKGEQSGSQAALFFVLDYERLRGQELVEWIDRCGLEGGGVSSDDPAVQEVRLLTDGSWMPADSLVTRA